MDKIMNCFLVRRSDKVSWCEDYAAVVIAEDEKHAERKARWDIEDFKKAQLEVMKIDLSVEHVVLTANSGA